MAWARQGCLNPVKGIEVIHKAFIFQHNIQCLFLGQEHRVHRIFPVTIFMGPQYHSGKSRHSIDLGMFKVQINSHFNVFQHPIPCHFPQDLRNSLIFPAPGTPHIPFAMKALNRFHAFSP